MVRCQRPDISWHRSRSCANAYEGLWHARREGIGAGLERQMMLDGAASRRIVGHPERRERLRHMLPAPGAIGEQGGAARGEEAGASRLAGAVAGAGATQERTREASAPGRCSA